MQRHSVTEELKKVAPASLKVTMRDGTEKPVAVPKNRNRWSRTQQVLDSLPWVTIECLDKDGKLLKLIEDDEELDAVLGDEDDRDAGLAKLLLEVMRTSLKEARMMVDSQMRAMASTLQAMADGQQALVKTYQVALSVQQQNLLAAAPQSENESAEMMKMFQMAMMLMNQRKTAPVAPAGE